MKIIRKKSFPLKEEILSCELPCGLPVFVSSKREYNKKFAILSTRYGSLDREFIDPENNQRVVAPDGVAHFLEHKLFEEKSGDVFDKFAKNGASSNAGTSFISTSFIFSCTDYFEKNLRLLLNFVCNPYFSRESIERERFIIAQEIRMYQDNPDWRVLMNLLNGLYHEHPIKNDITGTLESIAQIDESTLHRCHRIFYHPSNMALFVAGGVDPDRVFCFVDKFFSKVKTGGCGKIQRVFPKEPRQAAVGKITERHLVSRHRVLLGFKDDNSSLQGRELVKREILSQILLDLFFGKSSSLHNSLYKRGLIDDSFSTTYACEDGFGFSAIGGETRDPYALERSILQMIRRARRKGVNPKDCLTYLLAGLSHF